MVISNGTRMEKELKIPNEALKILNNIPEEFDDDGCTGAPDSIFRFNFRWACRIHNWRYCSRCHPAEEMNQENRYDADKQLRRFISESLPWRWKWIANIYYLGVWAGGGLSAYDSCGPLQGEKCRHGIYTK